MKKDIATRFWSKVLRGGSDECWPFTGALNKGYGRFSVGRGMQSAHRIAYLLAIGDPGALDVLHSCDNPRCCNPNHLRLGNDLENTRDKLARNRQARGNSNGRSKLTEDEVVEIKRALLDGVKMAEIARSRGLTPFMVFAIKSGLTWKHVEVSSNPNPSSIAYRVRCG